MLNKKQALNALNDIENQLQPHRSKLLVKDALESLRSLKGVVDLMFDNTIAVHEAINPGWESIRNKIALEVARVTKANGTGGEEFSLQEEIEVMSTTCLVRGLQEQFPTDDFDSPLKQLEECWKELRAGTEDTKFFGFSPHRKGTPFAWFSLGVGYRMMAEKAGLVQGLAEKRNFTTEDYTRNRDELLLVGLIDAFLYRSYNQFGNPTVGCFQQRAFHDDLADIQRKATEVGENFFVPYWNTRGIADEEVFNAFWDEYVKSHEVEVISDESHSKQEALVPVVAEMVGEEIKEPISK